MGDPVVHFEISSSNAEQLARFYEQAFGWKAPWDPKLTYALVDPKAGGRGIGGGIGGQADGQNRVTVYIEVADTDAALRKIERLGGRTLVPTTSIPNVVTFALFTDPEGNAMGLTKALPAPARPAPATTARTTKTTRRKTTRRSTTGARTRAKTTARRRGRSGRA
jgi:predicted enzyme related to lactoylglutathione lyase